MVMSKQLKLAASILSVTMVAQGCGANENILKSGNEPSVQSNATITNEPPTFASDLAAMHTAGFTFIYELRRRDGNTIDPEDVRVIKQLTVDTNRRVKADNDKAVLIGSNFELATENLTKLKERFMVEDHSEPLPANVNVNTNTTK